MMRRSILLLASVLLAGCTGGGGAASHAPPTPTPDPDAPFLEVVRSAPVKPEQEPDRKLLLARVELERGRKEAGGRGLDALEKTILELPQTEPGQEEGTINFVRMHLLRDWVLAMLEVSPERALAGAKRFGADTNPSHHARLVSSLAAEADCRQPAVRSGLLENAQVLLATAEEHVKARSRSVVVWTPEVAEAATAVGLHCADPELPKQAAAVLAKVRRQEDARFMYCELAASDALATYTQDPARALAELGKLRDPMRETKCVLQRLRFLADALEIGPPRPDADGVRAAAGAALNDVFKDELDQAELCWTAGALDDALVSIAPDAASELAARMLESWRKSWSASKDEYCKLLPALAGLGRRLAAAGRRPDWLCGLIGALPDQATAAAEAKGLDGQRPLVAAHLSSLCSAEADPVLDAFASGGSLDSPHEVLFALAEADPAKARAIGERLLARATGDKKYDVATAIVRGVTLRD